MKKCTDCGCSYPDDYNEPCSNCLNKHLVQGFFIGQEVYINGKRKGTIIGTGMIVRNGLIRHQYIVQVEVMWYSENECTDCLVVHGDNLKEWFEE